MKIRRVPSGQAPECIDLLEEEEPVEASPSVMGPEDSASHSKEPEVPSTSVPEKPEGALASGSPVSFPPSPSEVNPFLLILMNLRLSGLH